MANQINTRLASQIQSAEHEVAYLTEDLTTAYAALADQTAGYAERAKTGQFTDISHIRNATENISFLSARLKTANEKLTVLRWIASA